MAEQQGSSDLFAELSQYADEEARLREEITFGQYLDRAVANPSLVRTAHQTLLGAITSRPDFFQSGSSPLFGMEKTTGELVRVLDGGARGLEIGKRILLLMGPPGGGKTTLVTALKRGLEAYTRTDEGALYTIGGCPMNEEPLHLLPRPFQAVLRERHGIHVEGDLCPHCENEHGGKKPEELKEVPVKRFTISESQRRGIGTFKPADPKSQDLSELVGSVDISKLSAYGTSSDPRAYRFDGELNVANRGLMEFVEMLKVQDEFLYALLDLAQDRQIKSGRFANISADEVILAHTNEAEYAKFVANKANEAMKDRIVVVRSPYNLRVSDEAKIYDKMIGQGDTKVHISPQTLRVSAMFAVLSRLSESPKMDAVRKMKAYDGEHLDGVTDGDIKEVKEENSREGMDGISPRYVMDCLAMALIEEGRKCLNPLDALRALRDGIELHTTRDLSKEDKEKLKNLIGVARAEFDEVAKKEIQAAFVYSFAESAQTLFNNYVDNIEAYLDKRKIKDPITDEDKEPDERLMRSLEDGIGVPDSAKKDFRAEIRGQIGSLARRGEKFDYTSHFRLKEAIEKKLFADLRDVIKITTSTRTPDKDQLAKINEVADRLMAEKGYCAVCANDLIKYVGTMLSR